MMTIKEAENAGRAAFNAGMLKAPCMDKTMCGAYGDSKTVANMSLLLAWDRGWTDENLKAPLPEV